MSEPRHAKIPVNVSPGMFTDEYAVEISLPSGKTASLFTETDNLVDVDLSNKTGWLIVEIDQASDNNDRVIVLPAESIEFGTKWLRLPHGQLEAYDFKQCSNPPGDPETTDHYRAAGGNESGR